jgi:hypothetical protein
LNSFDRLQGRLRVIDNLLTLNPQQTRGFQCCPKRAEDNKVGARGHGLPAVTRAGASSFKLLGLAIRIASEHDSHGTCSSFDWQRYTDVSERSALRNR